MFEKEFHFFLKAMYYLPMFFGIAIAVVLIWAIGDYFKIKKNYRIIVAVLVSFLVSLCWIIPIKQEEKKTIAKYNEQKEKYEQAKAVFDEQCKKAGEKIYRTVDNVDGVILLNLIGEKEQKKYDPMWEDAAINHVLLSPYTAEQYIDTFLSYDVDYNVPEQKYHYWTNGYKFVDVLKKNDNSNIDENTVTRYTRVGNLLPTLFNQLSGNLKFNNHIVINNRFYNYL
ncbi:MAG: hypothetical protein IJ780_02990 [Neisseriaceae bacterium]|nr:hypothetical protein [Neisseriaceae bacterium]